mgnify:CR=1 FL=1
MFFDHEQPSRLSQSERLSRIRLARSSNIGPITFRKLLDRFGTARDAIEQLPDIIAKTKGFRKIVLASRNDTVLEIELAQKCGAKPVIWGDPEYPALLARIEDAPPYFYAIGRVELLARPAIGLVGARNASANGCGFARKLSHSLCDAGYVVVSGMARGIDGAVHEAALKADPNAVLGGGVDVIYPREHRDLYGKLCEQGCVISEMPPGLQPQARHFPKRNRIISGLSYGTVVIEAGRNSGSLITARFAGEQGRDVFAVPGSPTDPRAAGPNSLIRDGAILCDSADVILDALRDATQNTHLFEDFHQFNTNARSPEANSDPARYDDIAQSIVQDAENSGSKEPSQSIEIDSELGDLSPIDTDADQSGKVLDLLSTTPLLIDDLIRASELPANSISSILIELELAGRVERHPGNRVSRIAK